jgi:hypothetical protein
MSTAVPLNDGQQLDSGGDLSLLPNEVLTNIFSKLWPTQSLLQVAWTCQLLRDNCLNNYVALLRYGLKMGDWQWHFKYTANELYFFDKIE